MGSYSWFSSNNGYKYRCVVTFKDKKKTKVTSDVATLYVANAQSFKSSKSKSLQNAVVAVEAPEGAFPAGTTMDVADVNAAEYVDAINEVLDNVDAANVTAVDISFNHDGAEVEPANGKQVTVTLKADAVKEGVKLVHIDDFGVATEVAAEDIVSIKDGEIVFKSDAFSVYAVVEPGQGGEGARATVNFYTWTFTKENGKITGKTRQLVTSYYVKNADSLDDLELIVADPGVGTLEEGLLFYGWSVDDLLRPDQPGVESTTYSYVNQTETYVGAAYNPKSLAMTIDEVREYLYYNIIGHKREGEGTDPQGFVGNIIEGDVVDVYAMLFKYFDVVYYGYDYDPENELFVSIGADTVLLNPEDDEADYKVGKSFTPMNGYNFEGWEAKTSGTYNNIVKIVDPEEAITADTVYPNDTVITVKGDIIFNVVSKQGNWLVFEQNGKGATYVAPKFVYLGDDTVAPGIVMQRLGYQFGGWYDTKEHAAAHAADTSVTEGEFEFGHPLEGDTTVYASWIPNKEANYTVIIWGQNQKRTGYEVLDSYVGTGRVGQNIPYTFVDNGDEDYVTGVGDYGHYTGFTLKAADIGQEVTITPEGDAVLNLHFDRIEYNFRFYLYRSNGNNYDYANNSGNGGNSNDLGTALNGLVTWHTDQTQHPGVTADSNLTIESETIGNRTYYFFTMHAYYGEDISGKWPKYSQITGCTYDGPGNQNDYDRQAVSFVMMVGTKLKPNPTNQGSGTVKGIITILNENILGATNNANGNYVVIRFPDSYYNWRYHIWFEAIEGEEYPGGTHDYNGKTYYQVDMDENTAGIQALVVRSSNTTDANQNEPKYDGFDYVTRLGQIMEQYGKEATGQQRSLMERHYTI